MDLVDDVERLLSRKMINDLPMNPRQLYSGPVFFGGPGRNLPYYRMVVADRVVPYEIDVEGHKNGEGRD